MVFFLGRGYLAKIAILAWLADYGEFGKSQDQGAYDVVVAVKPDADAGAVGVGGVDLCYRALAEAVVLDQHPRLQLVGLVNDVAGGICGRRGRGRGGGGEAARVARRRVAVRASVAERRGGRRLVTAGRRLVARRGRVGVAQRVVELVDVGARDKFEERRVQLT